MRQHAFAVLVAATAAAGCWIANGGPAGEDAAEDALGAQLEPPNEEPVSGAEELEAPLPRLEGQWYEAFDLNTNRPLAHRIGHDGQQRAVWVDAGAFDFVRYISGNHHRDWLVQQRVEDPEGQAATVAGVRGTSARLSIPGQSDAELLKIRLFNPTQQSNEVTLQFNGERLPSASLEPGWQTVELPLEEGNVGVDNELQLDFSNLGRIGGALSGGGVDWVYLGPDSELQQGGPHQLHAEQHEPLEMSPGQGLSWVVWLHDDAALELQIDAEPGCGPLVDVVVEDGDGGVESIEQTQIELVDGRGNVQQTVVELDVDDEQVGRVDIAAVEEDCGDVGLDTARLVRPGDIDGVPEEFEPPEYVLVWLIDTLRADYLPIHFDTDVQAPNLEQLAEGGVSFETAYVQGTESRASHASLFTGNYPDRHGVMTGGTVDPHLPILPHFFRDEGYRTANFSTNGYVSHLLNLNRGWDYYRNYIHEEAALDAESVVEAGLEWVERTDSDPFLLYLGTIDPHATYWRHDEFIELYEPADYQGRFERRLSGHDLEDIKAGAMQVTEREQERIINLYKNEITYNDYAFGQLREAFEEKGIWEDTLVIVTSDHGEEFWEHGSVGHGHNVHQEMVHVPLMFHYPRELPEGRTVRSGGEVVDVVPTVRDMLGLDPLDDRQGRSLLGTIYGEHGGYPAPVIATQYQLEYGLQIRDWKLYLDGGGVEVFDRSVDPLETEDVAADHPLATRWLRDSIGWFRAHRANWDKTRWGVATEVSDRFLEFVREDG